MKTHEIAKHLSALSRVLRAGPNVELTSLRVEEPASRKVDASAVPVALSTLAMLSEFGKEEWLSFISEHNLPIDVRPRDAARDILGKLLKYLVQNPQVRNQLSHSSGKDRSTTSNELRRTLQLLLNP
jgi:hypothetical protein